MKSVAGARDGLRESMPLPGAPPPEPAAGTTKAKTPKAKDKPKKPPSKDPEIKDPLIVKPARKPGETSLDGPEMGDNSQPIKLDDDADGDRRLIIRSGLKKSFTEAQSEHKQSAHFKDLKQRDLDARIISADYMAYTLENMIAADSNVRFYILIAITVFFTVVLGLARLLVLREEGKGEDLAASLYIAVQVLISAGYDNSQESAMDRIIYILTLLVGMTVVAVLIGLISESVNDYMAQLSAGSSKVVETNHCVILGWNESTCRVICQIAFLRRIFMMQNESWERKLLPWRRVKPSSPLACCVVVVMNNTKEKEDMQAIVGNAFTERAINPQRTKIGRDVIFRKGDPSDNHDLVRVAAHKAVAICVMMNESDTEEQGIDEAAVSNSATLRTVLALRNIIFSNNAGSDMTPGFRVVVQLSSECSYIRGCTFLAPDGHDCLFPQDLTKYVNSLLFFCASKPNLSRIFVSLLDFKGVAIRARPPHQLRAGPNNELGWFTGKTMKEAMLNHRWGNGVLIGVDDEAMNISVYESAGTSFNGKGAPGIMSDPDRVILPDDVMVFVSPSSTPSVSLGLPDFAEEADTILGARKVVIAPGGLIQEDGAHEVVKPKPQHVLVCGWRQIWEDNPERFIARCNDVIKGMPQKKGSTITTVNDKTPQEIAEIVKDFTVPFTIDKKNGGARILWTKDEGEWVPGADAESIAAAKRSARATRSSLAEVPPDPVPDGWLIGTTNVALFHYQGSPTSQKTMQLVVDESVAADREPTTAICLGSAGTGEELSAAGADTRVMATMLVLRVVTEGRPNRMHVVAENRMDQTAMLALGPKGAGYESDMLNTQAIIARSLVMNLAYPQIYDALSELTTNGPGLPELELMQPGELGICGLALTFGALQHVLARRFASRAVAVGYSIGSEIFLGPKPDGMITWGLNHRVIAIFRDIKGEETVGEEKGSHI